MHEFVTLYYFISPNFFIVFSLILLLIKMDDDRIRMLLDESCSSSGYEDENDSEVEDYVEVQEETYDTEQEDDDDETDMAEANENFRDFYLGKDGQTRWNK